MKIKTLLKNSHSPVILLTAIFLFFGGINAFSQTGMDGDGTMTVTPVFQCGEQSGTSYTFSFFGEGNNNWSTGAMLTIEVPWDINTDDNLIIENENDVIINDLYTTTGGKFPLGTTITVEFESTANGSSFDIIVSGSGVNMEDGDHFKLPVKTMDDGGDLTNIDIFPEVAVSTTYDGTLTGAISSCTSITSSSINYFGNSIVTNWESRYYMGFDLVEKEIIWSAWSDENKKGDSFELSAALLAQGIIQLRAVTDGSSGCADEIVDPANSTPVFSSEYAMVAQVTAPLVYKLYDIVEYSTEPIEFGHPINVYVFSITEPTIKYYLGDGIDPNNEITSPYTFDAGVTTVTVAATNSCYDTPVTNTFTVTTGVAPQINCPDPFTTYTSVSTMGDCAGDGTFTMTYDAADPGNSNPTTAMFSGMPEPSLAYSTDGGSTYTSFSAGSPFTLTLPKGVNTVRLKATNLLGSETCDFDITVIDDEAPIFDVAADIETVTSADGGYNCDVEVAIPEFVWSDNCPDAVLTYTVEHPLFPTYEGNDQIGNYTFYKGLSTITYTMTDAETPANVSTDVFTVFVFDDEAPVFDAAADIETVTSADGGYNCDVEVAIPEFVWSDNCPDAVLTYTIEHPLFPTYEGDDQVGNYTFYKGLSTITYTMTDAESPANVSTDVFTVFVFDDEAPIFDAAADIETVTSADGGYNCDVEVAIPEFVWSDNCPDAVLTYTIEHPLFPTYEGDDQIGNYTFYKGLSTITYTMTDAESPANVSTDVFTVFVFDDEAPIFDAAADIETVTSADGGYNCDVEVAIPEFVWSDNCPDAVLTYTIEHPLFPTYEGDDQIGNYTFYKGLSTITYTMTDAESPANVSTDVFTVFVFDDEAPVFDAAADIETVTSADGGYNCDVEVAIPEFVWSDNCPDAVLTYTIEHPLFPTYEGDDQIGNYTFYKGLSTITYTMTDAETPANVSTDVFTVFVFDDEAPVFDAAADIETVTSADGGYNCDVEVAIPEFVWSDNCPDAVLTYTIEHPLFPTYEGDDQIGNYTFYKGLSTITYTMTDAESPANVSTDVFTVFVFDDEAPVFDAAADIETVTSADGGYNCDVEVAIPEFVWSDNCPDAVLTYTIEHPLYPTYEGDDQIGNYTFYKGLSTITYTMTDAESPANVSTDVFTVFVFDDEAPVFDAAADILTTTSFDGPGDCATDYEIPVFNWSDNCPNAVLTWSMVLPDGGSDNGTGQIGIYNFYKGVTTVTYTMTDAETPANVSTDEFTVTVIDDEDPNITCVADQERSVGSGQVVYTVMGLEFDPSDASDNCPGSDAINDYNGLNTLAGAEFSPGSYLITWTITDEVGNNSSCSFNVEIIDQNICAYYSGALYGSNTQQGSDKFGIVLAVTVVEEEGDICSIEEAEVYFYADGNLLNETPVPVGIVEPGNYTFGTAVFEWTGVDAYIGTHDIDFEVVGGCYTGGNCGEPVQIEIMPPHRNSVTGIGNMELDGSSSGKMNPVENSQNNISINSQWAPNLRSLKGDVNFLLDAMPNSAVQSFKIDQRALRSLAVVSDGVNPPEAIFTGVVDISTNAQKKKDQTTYDPDALMVLRFIDDKDKDYVAITIFDKDGGVHYSSSWINYGTTMMLVPGGNGTIHLDDGTKFFEFSELDNQIIDGETALQIYPNPTSGPVSMEFSLEDDGNTTIDIYSASGQVVQRVYEGFVKGGEVTRVHIDRKLARGMYFVQLRSGDELITTRLIVGDRYGMK